ncbi:hypothetical protein CC86DRAFT_469610 [Ophiobolus disseminans]|uniref:Uncharacterized protein n=1 Tax=Ophiobolus disseminans TaxID=1469910 RepID=A0A6A6ZPJ7_9PLEO|nr:hypothetical protein CC86DRAFT_469610 [Ophiobolus disseminans]
MGAGKMVLMGLRTIALVSALAVVGLGAWSKYIIHDAEIRSASVLRGIPPEPANIVDYWRTFFTTITDGTMRIWISIAAGTFGFLTGLLAVLSTMVQRLEMPGSVRVPLEVLSMCSMATAFGCTLSFALNLGAFSSTRLQTSDADLAPFTMILPLSQGLVVCASVGCSILLATSITAMVQACTRARDKESCSFEPTASALGMGHGYQAIVPPEARSRPPTMYDPRKPLPKQLEAMPETDEEKALSDDFSKIVRVDSGLSDDRKDSLDAGKDESWPLNAEKPRRAPPVRPARPWSNVSQRQKSPDSHAL